MKKNTILPFLFCAGLLIPLYVNASFSNNLGYQSKGKDVAILQSFLSDQGFFSGSTTGAFYSGTKKALTSFQKAYNINPATGFLGSTTRGLVNYILNPTGAYALGINDGLVGFWNFNIGGGDLVPDASEKNARGTFVGNPIWNTSGKSGGAVTFNGTGSYIKTPPTATTPKGSIAVWVKPSATLTSGKVYTIFSAGGPGNNLYLSFNGYGYGAEEGNAWNFSVRGEYGKTLFVIAKVPTNEALQEWQHLVVTWDTTSGASLYINGVLQSSVTGTTGTPRNASQTISAPSSPFLGDIDELRNYSRVLTPSEVVELYTSSNGTTPPPPRDIPILPLPIPTPIPVTPTPPVVPNIPLVPVIPVIPTVPVTPKPVGTSGTPSIFQPGLAVFLNRYNPPYIPGCEKYPTSITDYSRFNYDPTTKKMLMFGGGHSAAPRTDIDALDLTKNFTWQSDYPTTPISQLVQSNLSTTTASWISTGHPTSRHTYDMTVFAQNTGELIMLGAGNYGAYCQGQTDTSAAGKIWHYNPTTKVWKASTEPANFALGSEYDPISGKIISISRYDMTVYDPVVQKLTKVLSFVNADLSYAQNLVYFSPNQKMYYIMDNSDVYEVTLDRLDFTKSTIVKMTGLTGDLRPRNTPTNYTAYTESAETGWAYDSENKIIGGGVLGGIFYAFNPLTKNWNATVMQSDKPGLSIGNMISHTIDYDEFNKMFVLMSGFRDTTYGAVYMNTWGYKYKARTSGSTPVPPSNSTIYSVSSPYPVPNFISGSISPTPTPLPPQIDTQAPSAPLTMKGVPISSSQISLSWDASTDNIKVIGYRVYRNNVLIATVTTTSYTDIVLTPSTAYIYYVAAIDQAQNVSNPSTKVSVTTSSAVVVPINTAAPTDILNLKVDSVTQSTISLSWTPSTGGTPPLKYSVGSSGTGGALAPYASFRDIGLQANTTYNYGVAAVDSKNNSTKYVNISATTLPLPAAIVGTNGVIPGPAAQNPIPESDLHISDSKYTGTTWQMITSGWISWKNLGGDWKDKNGTLQGPVPWATAGIQNNSTEQAVTFDVTDLVKAHLAPGSKIPNRGWLVHLFSGSTIAAFYTREYNVVSNRPKLVVTTTTGTFNLDSGADIGISNSSSIPYGANGEIGVEGSARYAIWFDMTKITGTITSAKFTLTTSGKQFGGYSGLIALFPVDLSQTFITIPVEKGIASKYTNDIGLEKDSSVLFMERFRDLNLEKRGWHHIKYQEQSIIGETDPVDVNYKSLAPGISAYKMTIPKGTQGGDFARWIFWSNLGYEPEELYVRAYVRMGTNFDSMGGKFPLGIDGTYFKFQTYNGNNPLTKRDWTRPDAPEYGGNGGNTSNGKNGWTARGGFLAQECDSSGNCATQAETNPLIKAGNRLLNFYAYYADQPDSKGQFFNWERGLLGVIPKNKWASVEQYTKVNTVNPDGSGNKDGILRVWVDGRLAFEKTDFRVRHWPGNYAGAINIKTYGIWLDFFHGGLLPATSPMDAYLSNLVISKSYIGPANAQ